MFPCVWLHFKKFSGNIFWCLEKKKENTNLEKHKPQPRSSPTTNPVRRPHHRSRSRLLREIAINGAISRSVDHDMLGSSSLAYIRDLAIDALRDRAVDRDLDPVRSREGEIVINSAISRRRDRDQRRLECLPARSRSARTGARSSPAIVGLCRLSRARALSLSVKFFGNTLKGK